ncbi:MAG TPA: ABC transporter permease [Acidobacteriota bacterium]|jgi:NitT/TauT family transport system permease protein
MVKRLIPFSGAALLVICWQVAVQWEKSTLIPDPWQVVKGLVDLVQRGLLFKYVVASLFRVTWGYLLAVITAIPFGLILGWFRRGEWTFNPLIQVLRPISPLAWTPISILWFGVGDVAAIFLIFLASFLPLTVAAMNAVRSIEAIHLNIGRNFGLSPARLIREVIYPAVMPQLIVALRITLGIAWLVVVAAEMIAVNSGLGFLIIDSRNAGNRYDLVVAGMVLIGFIGLLLDVMMRKLETLKILRWGYTNA